MRFIYFDIYSSSLLAPSPHNPPLFPVQLSPYNSLPLDSSSTNHTVPPHSSPHSPACIITINIYLF